MKDIGLRLKEAREKKGFSVQDVSVAIKINSKTLQAIEDGDFTQLPAKPFLRGFVQTYSKYLDLNVDEVMKTFAEEIGSTKPKAQAPDSVSSESIESTEEAHKKIDLFKKIGFVAAGLLAILLIYVIQKVVGRYEKEQQVAETQKTALATETPQQTASTDTAAATPTTPEATQENTETTPTTPATVVAPVATTPAAIATTQTVQPAPQLTTTPLPPPNTAKPAPATTTPTATQGPILVPPGKPVPVTPAPQPIKPEVKLIAETKPVEQKPVEVKVEAPKPVDTAAQKKAPQQIVIEALDNVEIRYQKDGGSEKTVRLKPEQILTLSADYKVSLNINDGGAVSIIKNGKDVGVPGNLGKPAKLNYP